MLSRMRQGMGAIVCGGFLWVSACDMPATKLSKEERVEELNWVIAKFEHNYAPLKYKEANLKDAKGQNKFNWQQKKSEYRAKAEADLSNEELLFLIGQFVAEVEDAHTSVNNMNSMLPGQVKVAYLGFLGTRYLEGGKDVLKVKSFVPTLEKAHEGFPVKVGDKILAIDDMDVYSFVQKHCPRNLGQEDSNRTAFMPNATLMNSMSCKLPEATQVKLSILRGDEELETTVPWIVKDYLKYIEEQQAAKGDEKKAEESGKNAKDKCKDSEKEKLIKETVQWSKRPLVWNLQEYIRYLSDASLRDVLLKDNFSVHYISADMLMQPIVASEDDKCEDDDKELGTLIPNDEFEVRIIKRDKGLVGYIRVPTFSPSSASKDAIEGFEEALESLHELNVQKIVLDLVNNGGGSLAYGLALANLLKGEKATEPSIEVRLNDHWLNGYQSDSLFASNDASREIARRRYESLKNQYDEGKWLSDKFLYSEVDLKAKPKKPQTATPVVLMVNEHCASMCDIFTADLKDNGVAKVIGRKTMGAGGNVVMHGISPRLNLLLSQTESLIVRSNGEYIENKGVTPDKVYETKNFDWKSGYEDFIKTACDYALE